MRSRDSSTPSKPRPLADWTDHGTFRAAFLELFPPEERDLLRRAGVVLALQALSGDSHQEPVVLSHLEAAAEDARMLASYLQEIHQKAQDRLPTERAERLAERAEGWAREVAGVAEAIEGALGTGGGEAG